MIWSRTRKLFFRAGGWLGVFAAAALLLTACGGGSGAAAPDNQPNERPYAFITGPTKPTYGVNENVPFDASLSFDPDGQIVEYEWDFNYDGVTFVPDGFATSNPTPTHAYPAAGIYTVALRVADNGTGADQKKDIATYPVFVVTVSTQVYTLLPGGASQLDFGNPVVGDPVDRLFFVFNGSSNPVTIASVVASHSEITVSGPTLPVQIAPGTGRQFTATFTSLHTQLVNGSINVDTDIAGTLTVAAIGTALPGFARAGSMSVARSYHTATLLNNGRVLIVGGLGASGQVLSSVEIYNPATGQFTLVPNANMNGAVAHPSGGFVPGGRAFHTATLLPDGNVLVAGGHSDANGQMIHDTAIVFDTALTRWKPVGILLSGPRTQHTASRVTVAPGDVRVILAGGLESPSLVLGTYEVLLSTGVPQGPEQPLAGYRYKHAATALADGRALVAGGALGITGLGDAELIDPAGGGVTATPQLKRRRYQHTLTSVYPAAGNPLVLAVGGQGDYVSAPVLGDIERFDPLTNTFQTLSAGLITPRRRHAAVDLGAGAGLLVVGGIDLRNVAVAGAELVIPTGPSAVVVTSAGGALHVARGWGHQATLLADGSVLITGGTVPGGVQAVADAERYIPQ